MDDQDKQTEAGVVADLTRKAMAAQLVTAEDGRSWLVTPEGVTAKEITDPNGLVTTRPDRILQSLTLQTADSLGDYVERFGETGTVLLADIDANRIVAAIDYHEPSSGNFVGHKATMTLPFSVEWQCWTGIDGKMMGQQDFAQFLEENAADVEEPAGADLLEVARDMRAVRGASFQRVVRTNGDDESFEYSEQTEARSGRGGTVEVPSKFKLRIPVYFGEEGVEVHAFLRWKLLEGQLLLGIKLHRPEHVRQAVFQRIVFALADLTMRPALFGRLG